MKKSILKDKSLLETGFVKQKLDLPSEIKEYVLTRDWASLDALAFNLCAQGGLIYEKLKVHHQFEEIEHLINVRNSDGDEDGIWHDDGSRYMAFSISLNLAPQTIAGGELFFRKKRETEIVTLKPLAFGETIIFLTGQYGFEHKVGIVTGGERISLAGWCF